MVRTIVLRITKLKVLHKRFLLQNNVLTLVIMLTENWNNWIPDLNNLHDNLFLKTQLADLVTAVPIHCSLIPHLSLGFLVTSSRDGFQSTFTNTHLLGAEVNTKVCQDCTEKEIKTWNPSLYYTMLEEERRKGYSPQEYREFLNS